MSFKSKLLAKQRNAANSYIHNTVLSWLQPTAHTQSYIIAECTGFLLHAVFTLFVHYRAQCRGVQLHCGVMKRKHQAPSLEKKVLFHVNPNPVLEFGSYDGHAHA
jgi:hypothetical protein